MHADTDLKSPLVLLTAAALVLVTTCTGCTESRPIAEVSDGGGEAGAAGSRYVILTNLTTADPYYQAVTILGAHRKAKVLTFDPQNLSAARDALKAVAARHVALVMKPRDIDINFARRLLMMSTELDADPFSDFAYGFITGATAADAVAFVNGMIKAETEGIADKALTISGYSASNINMTYNSATSFLKYLSPTYSHIYLKTGDAKVLDYFDQHSHLLLGVKMLSVGENGDPHMLWLFEGGNLVKDTWAFDKSKVENPPVSRLGLASTHIGKLKLYPAVALNGACHGGVLKRALVEGDILATFGDTGGVVRFYEMSDSFSFALSILKTGITGYFAPIGANNANDKGEEEYNLFLYDEPLGDIHKRTVDGVVMGFAGNRPKLRLFVEGESAYQYETLASGTYDPAAFGLSRSAMLSGRANRVYYGDPAFHPFARHRSASLKIVTAKLTTIDERTVHVELSLNKPAVYFPLWDKFHDGKTFIYTVNELPASFAGSTAVQAKSLGASGSYTRIISAVEQHEGKTLLHLEVDIPVTNDALTAVSFSMKLEVKRP